MRMAIEIVSLVLVGLVAGAELGSWCSVQPVVSRLPYEQFVAAEQGILRTVGRVMPVLMPLSAVLVVALIVVSRDGSSLVLGLRVAAALCMVVTLVTTLAVNVPIDKCTANWRLTDGSAKWPPTRAKWHYFQGVRGGLFAFALVLLTIPVVMVRR